VSSISPWSGTLRSYRSYSTGNVGLPEHFLSYQCNRASYLSYVANMMECRDLKANLRLCSARKRKLADLDSFVMVPKSHKCNRDLVGKRARPGKGYGEATESMLGDILNICNSIFYGLYKRKRASPDRLGGGTSDNLLHVITSV
jgi:hypothetical protein